MTRSPLDSLLASRTRRDFLRVAGASGVAGSALAVAACGGDEGPATTSEAAARSDAGVLIAALQLEHTAVAAYRAGLPLLDERSRAFGRRFLAQEREHVAALSKAIEALGVAPPAPRSAAEYRRSFPPLRDQDDFLRYALDLASTAVSAYLDAVEKLVGPELRQLVTAINGSEAQHISVLRGALGRPRLPTAFVGGRSP